MWTAGKGRLLCLHAFGVLQEGTVGVDDVAVERRGCSALLGAGCALAVLTAGDDRIDLRRDRAAPGLIDVHTPRVAPTVFDREALHVRGREVGVEVRQSRVI